MYLKNRNLNLPIHRNKKVFEQTDIQTDYRVPSLPT